MPGSVDSVTSLNDRVILQPQAGDGLSGVMNLNDFCVLPDLDAHRFGVIQQDVVKQRAVDLQGGAPALPVKSAGTGLVIVSLPGQKVKVPEVVRSPPSIGRSDFNREAG